MRLAWRQTPGARAGEDEAFLGIVHEALFGEPHPWGAKAWKKVHNLWVEREMPAREWTSLRSRYQRLVKKVLSDLEAKVESEPDARWERSRWAGPIHAAWRSAGMLDLGWRDLWARMRKLQGLSTEGLPEDEYLDAPSNITRV